MKRLAASFILLAVLLAARPVQAAFEDLGAGARAPGMGNAFTAVADDVSAYHYNPAGLGLLRRAQMSTAFSRLHMGLTDGSNISLSQVAYARPVKKLGGTLGVAYHQLSLSGLYGERSIYVSYGKQVWEDETRGTLFAGGSFKHLSFSFDRPPEARNSMNLKTAQVGVSDPVLDKDTGKSAFDLDLGLLYRYQYRYFFGFAVQHLNEPDLAISSNDSAPLGRAMRLALGYRALWINLTTELKLDQAPGGGSDKTFFLAGERFFPTLRHGQIGMRGSLGFGDRDFRQLTTGLTYRINKLQFDYAFLMPLGTLQKTAGTHRLGLMLHFGAPTPEEQYTADLIEKIELAKTPSAGYAYEFQDLPSPIEPVLSGEDLADVRKSIDAGDYDAAHERLSPHLEKEVASIALVSLGQRLQEVRYFFRQVDPNAGEWAASLVRAIKHFLQGRDRESLLVASQALSLKRDTVKLPDFLARMEEITKLKGERIPEGASISLLELKLNESETLFLTRNFEQAGKLCEDILIIQPNHPTALARIGSARYMQRKYDEAIASWTRALAFETDSGERETLKFMVLRAQKKIEPIDKTAAAESKAKWRAKPAGRPLDPKVIEKLYQLSVRQYAAGEWDQAAETLEKILVLEPENRQARRALRRLEAEGMRQRRQGQ
ncbi:MAG: type IX secretion system membrane protein PorP/SprF [Elusimicrobiota bacterium]